MLPGPMQTLYWQLTVAWHKTCSQRHPVGADHMSFAHEGGPMSFVWKMKERQEEVVVTLSPLNNSDINSYVQNVRKPSSQNLVDEVVGISS